MFSANAAGLNSKGNSLKHQIRQCNATIFTVQETNYKKKGRLNIEEFEVFEAIRKNKDGGGTLVGIHKSLEPVLIEEYSDSFELIVVEVKLNEKEVRVISGYGPQECWPDKEKMPFFVSLEEEISKAQSAGKSIIIEIDANSKLGPTYIKRDPKSMSPNGRILSGIIERHALTVANGVEEKSHGVITGRRNTKTNIEESVIDLVLLSNDLVQNLVSITIDEEKDHVLASITNTKKGVITHESDHNSIIS